MLAAYLGGGFPMDEESAAGGPVLFYEADPRAVVPLEDFRVPRSVRRAARSDTGEMVINGDFRAVLECCAERAEGTWLSPRLRTSYVQLHAAGVAHSVEWRRAGRLAGGLFGVAIGGLFTSESMFHRESDAGSLALAATGAHLIDRGFTLWDIQMLSDHTARFGGIEIDGDDYRRRLTAAVRLERAFAGT